MNHLVPMGRWSLCSRMYPTSTPLSKNFNYLGRPFSLGTASEKMTFNHLAPMGRGSLCSHMYLGRSFSSKTTNDFKQSSLMSLLRPKGPNNNTSPLGIVLTTALLSTTAYLIYKQYMNDYDGLFVYHGTPLSHMRAPEIQERFDRALRGANKALEKEGLSLSFSGQVPEVGYPTWINPQGKVMLRMGWGGKDEVIGPIDLKALDQESIKSEEFLKQEMIRIARLHIIARKTPNILISSLGAKFDIRKLDKINISIDPQEYIRVNGKRIVVHTDAGFWVLKAPDIHSYTLYRIVEDGDVLRLFDDESLVREGMKQIVIDLAKTLKLQVSKLEPNSRADALDGEEYFIFSFEPADSHVQQGLRKRLKEFPKMI